MTPITVRLLADNGWSRVEEPHHITGNVYLSLMTRFDGLLQISSVRHPGCDGPPFIVSVRHIGCHSVTIGIVESLEDLKVIERVVATSYPQYLSQC